MNKLEYRKSEDGSETASGFFNGNNKDVYTNARVLVNQQDAGTSNLDDLSKNEIEVLARQKLNQEVGDGMSQFLIASKYPALIDIGNKTLQIPQSGYCNMFFTDGSHINLAYYNKDKIDVAPDKGSSTFVFVNKDSGVISGKSVQTPESDEILLGWITWTGNKGENHINGLKTEVVNTPTKLSVAGLDAVAFGDSITWSYNSTKWVDIVADLLDLKSMDNQGVAGSSYAVRDGQTDSAVERAGSIKGDLILIEFGVNDWASNVPLGEFGSSDTNTLYGAVDYAYNTIITNNPNARIMVIISTKENGHSGWYDSYHKTKYGSHVDYVNIIKEVAGKYSLPIIDLFNNAGISPYNEAQASQYFRDGLHPSQAGEYVYARKIVEGINSLS